MKIAVGSNNPAKLQAVQEAFEMLFPDSEIECLGATVTSGVSDQPMSDEETMRGAQNRAMQAMKAIENAVFGIGLEGGLNRVHDTWFTGTFASVVAKDGLVGFGISPRVPAPKELITKVQEGFNLSDAVHEVLGISDIGKKEGLLGYMTNGVITRASASRDAIIGAMAEIRQQEVAQQET